MSILLSVVPQEPLISVLKIRFGSHIYQEFSLIHACAGVDQVSDIVTLLSLETQVALIHPSR